MPPSEHPYKKKKSLVHFSENFQSSPFQSKEHRKTSEADGALRSTLILFLLFGSFIILIAFLGEYGIFAYQEVKEKEQKLVKEIAALKRKEQTLLQEIDALQNNPDYIEALARKELGLVHKNEVVYFLPATTATVDK
ncbi:MAG: septum formation initiator family protein [SAR324 cluster bacterium]|nr:septum formation initiator family protein [SAR324 cluster bacterium]